MKLNLSTKEVKVGTFKVNTNVTREMVDDISKFNYATNYIKKSLVKPMNNIIIKIYDDKYNDNYYKVDINQKLLERYTKIYKVTKDEGLRRILEAVEICEKNRSDWMNMTEESLADELAYSINKDILKRLFMLGSINYGKSGI